MLISYAVNIILISMILLLMLTMFVDTEYAVYCKIACPTKKYINKYHQRFEYIRENIDHFVFDMTEISDMMHYNYVHTVIRCTY